MKRIVCIALSVWIILSLFSGCKATKEPDDSTNDVATTTGDTKEAEQADGSEPEDTTGNTMPSNVGATERPTEPTAQNPTEPTTQKPTEPTTQKPTEPIESDSNILDSGIWDVASITWKVTTDGVLTIEGNRSVQSAKTYSWTKYSNVITKIVIGEGITNIPSNAFREMSKVVSVELGSTIESIDESAFYSCTALESVTIPKSTKKIFERAFARCTNLKTLSFAADCQLEEIGEYAFSESGVQEFVAPANLQIIGPHAFEKCENLESVRLEGSVSILKVGAFRECTGLKHLVLGESIIYVDAYIFEGCENLTTLEYYAFERIDFENFTKLTTVVIGGKRTETGIFNGCTALSSVTIGPNVTQVSPSAFIDCRSLTAITLPSSITTIGINAFRNTGITKITIPSQVSAIEAFAFGSTPLEEIVFTGNAPAFDYTTSFSHVTATAYYPAGNSSWKSSVRQNYGGTLTWVAAES